MVKRQREKLYATTREHRQQVQQQQGYGSSGGGVTRATIPFSHCALSMQPTPTPVLCRGIVFDAALLYEYIQEHDGCDPVKGFPDAETITLLQTGADGEWWCPVLDKRLTSGCVAIAVVKDDDTPSSKSNSTEKKRQRIAHVYAAAAYKKLCSTECNDLVTGAPFDRYNDVFRLVDHDPSTLHCHRQQQQEQQQSDGIRHDSTAQRIMEKIQKKQQAAAAEKKKWDDANKDGDSKKNDSKMSHVVPTTVTVDSCKFALLARDVDPSSLSSSGTWTNTSSSNSKDKSSRPATVKQVVAAQVRQLKIRSAATAVKLRLHVGADETTSSSLTIQLRLDRVPHVVLYLYQYVNHHVNNDKNTMWTIRTPGPQHLLVEAPKSAATCAAADLSQLARNSKSDNSLGTVALQTSENAVMQMIITTTDTDCQHYHDPSRIVIGHVMLNSSTPNSDKGDNINVDKNQETLQNWSLWGKCRRVVTRWEWICVDDVLAQALTAETKRLQGVVRQREGKDNAAASLPLGSFNSTSSSGVGKYLSKNLHTGQQEGTETLGTSAALPLPLKKKKKKSVTKFGNFSGW